jgi:hypothetical protein
MIEAELNACFTESVPDCPDEYAVAYTVLGCRRKFPWIKRTAEIRAHLALRTNEIGFQEAADALLAELSRRSELDGARVSCTWLVSSPSGGIYLYEAIATRRNARYRKARHSFVVLNTLNGEMSFGPGHAHNEGFSRAMRDLIEEWRIIPQTERRRRLGEFIDRAFTARYCQNYRLPV